RLALARQLKHDDVAVERRWIHRRGERHLHRGLVRAEAVQLVQDVLARGLRSRRLARLLAEAHEPGHRIAGEIVWKRNEARLIAQRTRRIELNNRPREDLVGVEFYVGAAAHRDDEQTRQQVFHLRTP